ncbi:MAG: osmotically inducible protein C [Deltaproteobacteria bacterium HGW-Deltaproteobacteria-13]|jgi:ribosomal protein S12 methylthiotransferase accessory factor|nr:MAG: osmotically inducible protein C [Deltaproteobacteria bacterium HGW-Deltaproteobacteria-13]
MESKFDITFDGNKKVSAHFRDFTIHSDQPKADGGENTAPSPFELFLASLGTCAGFYVASFCQSRSIPTDNIRIVQTVFRNDSTHMAEKINLDIVLPPDFPEKYKAAVIKAADTCSVRKHLFSPPEIHVNTIIQ